MKGDYSFRRSLGVEWFDNSNERVYSVIRNRHNDAMRASDDTDAVV